MTMVALAEARTVQSLSIQRIEERSLEPSLAMLAQGRSELQQPRHPVFKTSHADPAVERQPSPIALNPAAAWGCRRGSRSADAARCP